MNALPRKPLSALFVEKEIAVCVDSREGNYVPAHLVEENSEGRNLIWTTM